MSYRAGEKAWWLITHTALTGLALNSQHPQGRAHNYLGLQFLGFRRLFVVSEGICKHMHKHTTGNTHTGN